jgi:hypothetical protein
MALSPDDLELLAAGTRVTHHALEFAAKAGGSIHVWDEAYGDAWLRLHAGVEPPDGREFQELVVGDDTILVSLNAAPGALVVEVEHFPRRKLVAIANDSG